MGTDRLTLSYDGVPWSGTFSVLLDALAGDLLPEGPVTASVRWLGDGDVEQEVTGRLTAVDADWVHLDGVAPVRRGAVLSVPV